MNDCISLPPGSLPGSPAGSPRRHPFGRALRDRGALRCVLSGLVFTSAILAVGCDAESEEPGSAPPKPASGETLREAKQGVLGDLCTGVGDCDDGEFCVDGVCCESACGGGDDDDCMRCNSAGLCVAESAAVVCRPSEGVCDVEETCNGTDLTCPADVLDTVTECRAKDGDCDVAETDLERREGRQGAREEGRLQVEGQGQGQREVEGEGQAEEVTRVTSGLAGL